MSISLSTGLAAASFAGEVAKNMGEWHFDNPGLNTSYLDPFNRLGKYNRENYLWQQYQQEMATERFWQKYNSPLAQMSAYREAGLNPNLIYGQSSHNGQSVPHNNLQALDASAFQERTVGMPGFVKGMLSAVRQVTDGLIRQKDLDIKQQNADTKSSVGQSTISLNSARKGLLGQQSDFWSNKNKLFDATFDDQVYQGKLRNSLMEQNIQSMKDRHIQFEYNRAYRWELETDRLKEELRKIRSSNDFDEQTKDDRIQAIKVAIKKAQAESFRAYMQGNYYSTQNRFFNDTYNLRRDGVLYDTSYKRFKAKNEGHKYADYIFGPVPGSSPGYNGKSDNEADDFIQAINTAVSVAKTAAAFAK